MSSSRPALVLVCALALAVLASGVEPAVAVPERPAAYADEPTTVAGHLQEPTGGAEEPGPTDGPGGPTPANGTHARQPGFDVAFPPNVRSTQHVGGTHAREILLAFSRTVTLDDSYAFRVENLDTGNSTTFEVAPGRSVLVNASEEMHFDLYTVSGSLDPSPAVYVPDRRRWIELSASGDADTFSARERARYRVTVLHEGTPVDSTDPEPYVIGYESDFRQNSTNGTVEVSVAAGAIPTNLTTDLFVSAPDVRSTTLSYVPARDRFVGTLNVSGLPSGSYDVSVHFDFQMTASINEALTVDASASVPDDAAYPPDSTALVYDADADGEISIAELGQAAADYASSRIRISELAEVAVAFAAS